jgi:hypothetical protein
VRSDFPGQVFQMKVSPKQIDEIKKVPSISIVKSKNVRLENKTFNTQISVGCCGSFLRPMRFV